MKIPLLRLCRVALIGLSLISSISCAGSRQPLTVDTTVEANALKAGGIAYQAFEKTLLSEKKAAGEFGEFVSSIDNYNVTLEDKEDSFLFIFKVKPFHGRILKDGWFTFSVSKSGWNVDKIEP
jgi:hypothetical protein